VVATCAGSSLSLARRPTISSLLRSTHPTGNDGLHTTSCTREAPRVGDPWTEPRTEARSGRSPPVSRAPPPTKAMSSAICCAPGAIPHLSHDGGRQVESLSLPSGFYADRRAPRAGNPRAAAAFVAPRSPSTRSRVGPWSGGKLERAAGARLPEEHRATAARSLNGSRASSSSFCSSVCSGTRMATVRCSGHEVLAHDLRAVVRG